MHRNFVWNIPCFVYLQARLRSEREALEAQRRREEDERERERERVRKEEEDSRENQRRQLQAREAALKQQNAVSAGNGSIPAGSSSTSTAAVDAAHSQSE